MSYCLLIPSVLKLCEKLPNPSGRAFVNCESVATLPYISVTIGNKSFPLSPQQVCKVVLNDETHNCFEEW